MQKKKFKKKILSKKNINVYHISTDYLTKEEWNEINSILKSWKYPSYDDQKYLNGGNPMKLNTDVLKFNHRYADSCLLIAYTDDKIVGFAELFFRETPIDSVNTSKLHQAKSRGNICFSAWTVVNKDHKRQGISMVLEEAKRSLCQNFSSNIIMTLICVAPIPNIASLNRAIKIGSYFTGNTHVLKKDNIEFIFTEVLQNLFQN